MKLPPCCPGEPVVAILGNPEKGSIFTCGGGRGFLDVWARPGGSVMWHRILKIDSDGRLHRTKLSQEDELGLDLDKDGRIVLAD